MSEPAVSFDLERLQASAVAARDLLECSGAERWELFAKASTARTVVSEADAPARSIEVEETGIAVRTVAATSSGFAAASGLELEAARQAVEGARANEHPFPVEVLPPARLLGVAAVEGRRRLAPRGWALHLSHELVAAVPAVSGGRLAVRRSVVREGLYAWLLATGDGFVATCRDAGVSLDVELVGAASGRGVWRETLEIADPEEIEAERAAADLIGRATLTSAQPHRSDGVHDLLLHPEVAAHLLAALAPLFVAGPPDDDPLAGLLARDGRLAADALTLIDARGEPDAPIAAPCDGEGLPARRTLLLERGVPRHRLASYRDAMLFGETPRGGASRLSYRDYPASGVQALRVATDDGVPAQQLLEAAGAALYLLRPLNAIDFDLASGRLRLAACGVWLEGETVRGWQPTLELEGDAGRLLRRIEAVGTDLRWYETAAGMVGAPTLLLRAQPVAG